MQTGATLSLYFDQKVSAAYTGYLDNTKKNRLFKDAFVSLIERTYRADFEIKEWDEITYVTNVAVPVTPVLNILNTAALQIINVTIFSATVFEVTTALPHGLIASEPVVISGVAGSLTMNTANGSFISTTVISSTKFRITVASATGAYTANTGIVVTPATISDYWHLLAIKCVFNSPLYGITVTDATNRNPIILELNKRSVIRSGSKIVVSGITGNTAANGTFYARVRNDYQLALYSDVNLQVPVIGNGAYISGGTVSLINENYATALTSKMKIGTLNKPTAQEPYFEIANNLIKIHPLTQPCASATIDYIRVPQVVVDVANAVTDLTLYYPEKFLFALVTEAAKLFANETRDLELLQTSTNDQNTNP